MAGQQRGQDFSFLCGIPVKNHQTDYAFLINFSLSLSLPFFSLSLSLSLPLSTSFLSISLFSFHLSLALPSLSLSFSLSLSLLPSFSVSFCFSLSFSHLSLLRHVTQEGLVFLRILASFKKIFNFFILEFFGFTNSIFHF